MIDFECAECGNIHETPAAAAACCAEPEPEWDERVRERYEDDGRDYSDPGDFLRGYES